MSNKITEQEQIRRDKLKDLILKKENPFLIDSFKRNHNSKTLIDKYNKYNKEELNNFTKDHITIAGRIMTFRTAGKACFFHIQDFFGQIQIYARLDILGEKEFNKLINLDIGDFIGLNGFMMKTNKGELTLKLKSFLLLTKSLKPLPDKYHGLTDIETKYRKRYLDLIMSKESKEVFIKRTKIIRSIQNYLDKKGYLEVETPILQTVHGGAAAKPFKTFHNALDQKLTMRIATELYLKRLIVGGFEKVYEIGRLFRNEGISTKHNPEFTSIEIYTAYDNMEDTMVLCEEIIRTASLSVNDNLNIKYDNQEIDLSKPFQKVNMVKIVSEYTKRDFFEINDFKKALEIANKFNIKVEKHHTSIGHIINLLFEELIEPTIIQPTFIYNYPIEVSPLSKPNKNDPRFADRFELFILKREYANAFSELNNPIMQKERFKNQLEEQKFGNQETYQYDKDFVESLEYGMPPTGGIGIGIDRLVMLLTGQNTIKNVILFPTLKKN